MDWLLCQKTICTNGLDAAETRLDYEAELVPAAWQWRERGGSVWIVGRMLVHLSTLGWAGLDWTGLVQVIDEQRQS